MKGPIPPTPDPASSVNPKEVCSVNGHPWANEDPSPTSIPIHFPRPPSPSPLAGLIRFWARRPMHGTAAANPRTGQDRSSRVRRCTKQASQRAGGMAGTAPCTSWGPTKRPTAGAQAEVPKEFPISEAASARSARHPLPRDVLSPGQGWEIWGARSGLCFPASDHLPTSDWGLPSPSSLCQPSHLPGLASSCGRHSPPLRTAALRGQP